MNYPEGEPRSSNERTHKVDLLINPDWVPLYKKIARKLTKRGYGYIEVTDASEVKIGDVKRHLGRLSQDNTLVIVETDPGSFRYFKAILEQVSPVLADEKAKPRDFRKAIREGFRAAKKLRD